MDKKEKFLKWYFEGNFRWFVITWLVGFLMGRYL
jgi:hypothetical protein